MKKKKVWYDYLWIWAIIYFALSFFNILFAWFGMLDFLFALGIAIFGGNKFLVSLVEILNAQEINQPRDG